MQDRAFLELDQLQGIKDRDTLTIVFFKIGLLQVPNLYGVAIINHWSTPLKVFLSPWMDKSNGPTWNCIFWTGKNKALIYPCCRCEERQACLNKMMTSLQTVMLQTSLTCHFKLKTDWQTLKIVASWGWDLKKQTKFSNLCIWGWWVLQ